MNNISHKKSWNYEMTQMHVEPLPTPIVKGKYDGKSENYSVKLKLRRYLTSITLDFYEFNMSLFDNGNLEEFLFFVRFSNMTITASGMLEEGSKVQYLCRTFQREALRQFDSFYTDMGSATPLTVKNII